MVLLAGTFEGELLAFLSTVGSSFLVSHGSDGWLSLSFCNWRLAFEGGFQNLCIHTTDHWISCRHLRTL